VHVIPEFPKNPSGKVLKRVLRQRFAADEAGKDTQVDATARTGVGR